MSKTITITNQMTQSVKVYGVLTPAVLRKKEGGRYELVNGHRRKAACEMAGITIIPAVVREMSRDEEIGKREISETRQSLD